MGEINAPLAECTLPNINFAASGLEVEDVLSDIETGPWHGNKFHVTSRIIKEATNKKK